MNKKIIVAPSLLSADFADLKPDIEFINESDAGLFHLDVMDGHFVPNITIGIPVCKAIKKYAKKPLDVHLMISNPDLYIEDFAEAGAGWISVHVEACNHLHRTLQLIKSFGCKVGVSINPHTPLAMIEEVLDELDFVNIMTVNPGFGGQKFIENSYNKIERLSKMRTAKNLSYDIEVDGGVDDKNARKLINAGANVLVSGSYIFNHPDRNKAVQSLMSF